ncbi:chordin-like [Acanthaster planci]|uniref:Chordin-like n=1 Tax=Acanthaster planci TaxID=133434 RepID=A0A8B7ZS55_ACAPL|nr:chordin-like [Acanthaster planci]
MHVAQCSVPPEYSGSDYCNACKPPKVFNGTHCVPPLECLCYDETGYHKPFDKWDDPNQECSECVCFNNAISCYPKICPTVSCENPITPDGECCPYCPGRDRFTPVGIE